MTIQSLDLLYLCLSVSVIVITVLLSIILVRLMSLLQDVNTISSKVKDITEKVDTFITKPILLTKSIVEFLAPFVTRAEETFRSHRKKGS